MPATCVRALREDLYLVPQTQRMQTQRMLPASADMAYIYTLLEARSLKDYRVLWTAQPFPNERVRPDAAMKTAAMELWYRQIWLIPAWVSALIGMAVLAGCNRAVPQDGE